MSDRVLRFPDRTWDELEGLPQPLRNAAHRAIFHLLEEPVADKFELTQEFLGQMLGVRRQTASDVARQLQADGLIRYSRGILTITDGPGLERAACSCYGIVKAEFDLITGDA